MQYLVVVLILAGAMEYVKRERAHRRQVAYLRAHHQAMPPGPPRPLAWRIVPRAAASLLVLGTALYLVFGPGDAGGGTLRALGAALLPIVLILGMMINREMKAVGSIAGEGQP